MNRTRKIAAAGIGAAVVVVILAMILMVPNLHTQTPASTTPPSNGGTGGGGSGGSGTGPGTGSGTGSGTSTGNGTRTYCNVTGDGQGWDDPGDQNGTNTSDGNVSDSALPVVHPLDGNQTNETGDHNGGPCGASSGDPDSQGDRESEAHRSANADQHGWADELGADVLALVPLLAGAWSAAGNAVVTVGRDALGFLGGLASSLTVFVTRR